MERMTIGLLAGMGLAMTAASATAREVDIPSFCDYELRYDIAVQPGEARLTAPDEHWRLQGDRLWHNDRELTLDAEERRRLSRYRDGVERLVPAVSRLALDGAALGLEAVTITVALLGDDKAADALARRLAGLSERLQSRFDGHFLSSGRMGEGIVDEALEQEIDDIARDAAGKLTGNLASFVFRAIFDPREAEARAAHIERTVERRIEPRADALERRADALCADLRALDAEERALGRFDLLRATDPEA